MKLTGLIVATVAIALAGCQKPVAETTPQPPPPELPVVESVPAAPPPVPVAVIEEPPTSVAPPEPVRELAPAGVFYLRAKKSLTTDDGIVGFAPGTVLRETAPGEYATRDNQTLKLAAHEITNDLAEARQLAGYNAAIRAAQAQGLRQVMAAEAPKEVEEQAVTPIDAPAVPRQAMKPVARPVAPVITGGLSPSKPLNSGAYDATTSKIKHDSLGRPYWTDIYGRRRYDLK